MPIDRVATLLSEEWRAALVPWLRRHVVDVVETDAATIISTLASGDVDLVVALEDWTPELRASDLLSVARAAGCFTPFLIIAKNDADAWSVARRAGRAACVHVDAPTELVIQVIEDYFDLEWSALAAALTARDKLARIHA